MLDITAYLQGGLMPPRSTDQERATKVRQFYGLDGSPPVVAPRYLPIGKGPKGATDFENSVRRRLENLARGEDRYTAGPEEAAALGEAGLPLLKHGDKWIIDKAKANKEADVLSA
ncbi:hypothetical protein, partial [Streptomyces sp. C1-2]|uniref:hypothetical protein n=1 Tax=Streptomyces sp. C1-2 TaxID=2720022 RepID=UPI0019D04C8A